MIPLIPDRSVKEDNRYGWPRKPFAFSKSPFEYLTNSTVDANPNCNIPNLHLNKHTFPNSATHSFTSYPRMSHLDYPALLCFDHNGCRCSCGKTKTLS